MDLFDLFAKITLDTSEYESRLEGASEKTNSFAGNIKSGFATAAKVGAAAVTAASVAVTAFAKSSINAGIQFDSSMSQVAATMGTTVDQIGELRDFAMEMGSSTAFSASQAAEALNYMALAGYDAEESMQALPNVLNLAAAGGIELAAASDMVTDAQSALGLSMEESAELVDKMAMTSSKSNTNVAQLGEAILQIGATARDVKGGTTELSTALGILADNGIKSAEGGTHLRNIILSLQSPTDKAASALDNLGVQVFDAQGEMRGLNEIFGDLNAAMADMTTAEKGVAISTIFNVTDIAAVNALLANTGERWDELSEYIDNASGAAEAMASTQLDNLAGDITLFKSALEGAQIVISDQLTPTLREFVQFGSESVSTLTTAFQEGGLSGAMDALGTVLSDGLGMIIDMLPEVVGAGGQLLMALLEGIIINLPALGNGAVEIVMTLADEISGSLPELVPAAIDAVLKIAETLTDPANLDGIINAALSIILALAYGLIDSLPNLLEKLPIIIENFVTVLSESYPEISSAGTEILISLVSGIISSIPQLLELVPVLIEAFLRTIGSYYTSVFAVGSTILSNLISGIKRKIESVRETASSVMENVKTIFDEKVKEAIQWGKDLISNFISGIKEKAGAMKEAVVGVGQTVKNFIGFSEPKEGPLSDFHTYAPDMMELFAQGIRENEHLVTDQIKKSFDFERFGIGLSEDYFSPSGSGMSRAIGGGNDAPSNIIINITTELDGTVLARKMYTYTQNEATRRGTSLISG